MVPVVMLRVAFGHACLDVCASPGSETTQMLECLAVGDGRTAASSVTAAVGGGGDGFVVAMTLTRAARACSPSAVATPRPPRARGCSCAATMRNGCPRRRPPRLRTATTRSSNAAPTTATESSTERARSTRAARTTGSFATCRARATARCGRTRSRGASGGRRSARRSTMCSGGSRCARPRCCAWAACSLNPIEDEAVVVAILRAARGALELADSGARAPALPRRPGLETWRVFDYDIPGRRARRRARHRASAATAERNSGGGDGGDGAIADGDG